MVVNEQWEQHCYYQLKSSNSSRTNDIVEVQSKYGFGAVESVA